MVLPSRFDGSGAEGAIANLQGRKSDLVGLPELALFLCFSPKVKSWYSGRFHLMLMSWLCQALNKRWISGRTSAYTRCVGSITAPAAQT